MTAKYKVLLKKGNRMTIYRTVDTKEEAIEIMDNLNSKFLNKAYNRANKKGHLNISAEAHQEALSKTAIQFNG